MHHYSRLFPLIVLVALAGVFVHNPFSVAQAPGGSTGSPPGDMYLTYALIAFGLIALVLQVLVNVKIGQGWGPQSIRLFMLTIILVFALVPVTSSIVQAAAAPAYGLMGTIAGYLFGQSTAAQSTATTSSTS